MLPRLAFVFFDMATKIKQYQQFYLIHVLVTGATLEQLLGLYRLALSACLSGGEREKIAFDELQAMVSTWRFRDLAYLESKCVDLYQSKSVKVGDIQKSDEELLFVERGA